LDRERVCLTLSVYDKEGDAQMNEKPQLFGYAEAAQYLGIAEATLRRYVSSGWIGHLKLGPKLVRFRPREDLEAFLLARVIPKRVKL
jgi:excisionase family DNA binding protein